MFRKKTLIFAILIALNLETLLFCQQLKVLDVPAPPVFEQDPGRNENISNATINSKNSKDVIKVYKIDKELQIFDTRNPIKTPLNNPKTPVSFYYSIPKPPATTSTLLRIEAYTYEDGSLKPVSWLSRNNIKTTWSFTETGNGSSKLATVTTSVDNNTIYSWGKTSKKDGTFTFTRHLDGPKNIQTVNRDGELQYIDVDSGEGAKVRVFDKIGYDSFYLFGFGNIRQKYYLNNTDTVASGLEGSYIEPLKSNRNYKPEQSTHIPNAIIPPPK
jgi:hypothetical protein